MASSRQNSSQMLNSQSSSSNSTNSTSSRDKTVHTKSDAKNKHDKSSSSSSGHVPMSSNTIINSMNNMSKRKGTSFQITSVSVSSGNNQQQQSQQQRDNNGDDSADDLDESHTDDNISRITDYETPSFSEDTFSREDVFFAQPNAFGTAPVIPTSSQYGLAIVGPDLSGNGANLSDVHVSVSDAGINILGQLPNKQDVDHKNERFKVVKIESTEPFKRGRWMCMDYLDHTTLQAQDDGTDGSPKEDGDENVMRTKDSGLDTGLDGSEINDNGDMEHDNEGFDQEVMRAEMMNHHGGDTHPTQGSHEQQHHHQTMTSIPIHNENHLGAQQSQAQSMPQGHIQQIISQHEPKKDSRGEKPSSETLPTQASQNQPTNFGGGQNQHTFVADNSPIIPHHAQSMTPDTIQRSLQHDQQAHNQQQLQGVTLPTNILMQNLGLDQHHHQQQSQQKQQIGNASSHQATSSPLPTQGENVGEMENRQHQLQDSQTSQFQNHQVGPGDNKHQPSNESDQQLSGSGASTNDNIINNSVSDNNMNSNDGTQNTLSPSSSAGLGTVAEGGGAVGGASELNSNNASSTAAPGADDGQSIAEDSESHQMPVAAKSRHAITPAGLSVAALNINLSSLGPLYTNAIHRDLSSSNRVSRAASPSLGNSAENNSASGTSAVAIDNKIEQAMDLVKSHLMFAVREEVEVLKEKIAELMDRINQLEVENTILKANASQETLSQLTTAATIVAPQTQVQTSPAQPQSSPALGKINIDASILHLAGHAQNQQQQQQQPQINLPPQNPAATS